MLVVECVQGLLLGVRMLVLSPQIICIFSLSEVKSPLISIFMSTHHLSRDWVGNGGP